MPDELSHREVAELLDLIQRIDCTELSLDYGGFSIRIVRGEAGGPRVSSVSPGSLRAATTNPVSAVNAEIEPPLPQPAETQVGKAPSTTGSTPANWVAVRSPMVATFYAAPSP
ncbi:MAG: acetyl-CoA carboxylase biotin carboxyl carrier protein, partial [Mycobacteriales bacterium]